MSIVAMTVRLLPGRHYKAEGIQQVVEIRSGGRQDAPLVIRADPQAEIHSTVWHGMRLTGVSWVRLEDLTLVQSADSTIAGNGINLVDGCQHIVTIRFDIERGAVDRANDDPVAFLVGKTPGELAVDDLHDVARECDEVVASQSLPSVGRVVKRGSSGSPAALDVPEAPHRARSVASQQGEKVSQIEGEPARIVVANREAPHGTVPGGRHFRSSFAG